jgi:Peptidase MA superfamily
MRVGFIEVRGRFLLIWLIVISVLVPAWSALPARAAGVVTVLQSGAQSQFPKELDFAVQAQSNSMISSVRFAYRVSEDPVTTIAKATFVPSPRVEARYAIDLSRTYFPVGVTIHYQWLIQDQTGATGTSAWQDLRISDPRFLWHERTQGRVTLHWYDGDNQFADAVLDAAAKTLDAATQTGATQAMPGVDVYLYGNVQDFQSALSVGTNTWVGGQAYPLYRDVVILAPSSDLNGAQRSVAEEMTHVALDSTEEDPFGPLPTWLDEGLAVSAEGETDPAFTQALQQAAGSHQLLSIQSISGNFPEDAAGATLAYAESENIARYFLRTYGAGAMSKLIVAFRQGATSDEAFQSAIGMSTLDFQRGWEASLGVTPQATPAASAAPASNGTSFVSKLLAPVNALARFVEDLFKGIQTGKGTAG